MRSWAEAVVARGVQGVLDRVWYPSDPSRRPPLPLRLAAAPYRLAVAARNAAFDHGPARAVRLSVPCIGVGNLTVGGTGKTPLVAWIVEALRELGVRPAVVTRGYGGRERGPSRVGAGGTLREAERWGDEPALLARCFPDVPVVVGRDRVAAGRCAVQEHGADVVVADDAFQHRRLARDLDLAVVDASRGWGNGCLLPAGPLREPPERLGRADAVVLNRIGEAVDPDALRRTVCGLAPRALLLESDLEPAGMADALSGAPVELHAGSSVYAFCGLANPGSFRRSLEARGLHVAGWEAFRDHHPYRVRNVAGLAARARESGAAAAVTSAKDAVRIGAWPGPVPLYRAEVKLVMIRGRERLWESLHTLTAAGRT